jgi:UPF0755 protein
MKHKKLISLLLFLTLIILFCIYLIYRLLFGLNLEIPGERITLYIPEGSTYSQAMDTIGAHFKIQNPKAFAWIAEKKKYPALVKPGKYVIEKDISYTGLINLLRSGRQTPVNVTFTNIRYLTELAGRIGKQISADSAQIIDFLSDPDNYEKDGFTKETVISVFIPNTYQFFWNTDAKGLYSRMLREYNNFWNEERKDKAKAINLTQVEVATLASIVDDEVRKPDEMPRIAGVYLNRLRRGIRLQACPTIKFAMNNWTITRVLKVYTEVDSPYNTYKHDGFPPGPIGCPTIEGIDGVLNAEKHDYLYFAAKADFSGYHNFSRTLTEHNRYATEYQRELNKRKIYR